MLLCPGLAAGQVVSGKVVSGQVVTDPVGTGPLVSGRVTDAETGDPIPLVHAFIDGTAIGDVTGSDGSFSLRRQFVNPEFLELAERDGQLTATSPVPIRIENPWLGYRISLHRFQMSGSRQLFRWTGRIQFEDIARDDVDERRFEARRRETWNGSMRHFFRALATGWVPAEGFEAGLVDAVQTSWIELPYGMAIVDTLGNVVTDASTFPISHYGFWAWERLGDLLLADYLPR